MNEISCNSYREDNRKGQLQLSKMFWSTHNSCGPDSVVGIATGYGLDGPRIESRWGDKFSAPVQTGPGSPPSLLYNG